MWAEDLLSNSWNEQLIFQAQWISRLSHPDAQHTMIGLVLALLPHGTLNMIVVFERRSRNLL